MRRTARLLAATVWVAAIGSCGGDERRADVHAVRSPAPRTAPEPPPARSSGAHAAPLTLRAAPLPKLHVPRYETTGTVPQVSGTRGLRRVNAALLGMVLRDQHQYAPEARRAARRPPFRYRGVYRTRRPAFVSASTVVVSVVVPLLALYPGGNDGSGWLSTTVRMPSGDRVALVALFADPKAGLRALAAATKRLVATGRGPQARCARESLADPTVGDLNARGLRPRPRNYRDFALTPGGLVLAFHQAHFSAPPCGPMAFVVPYATIDPLLSPLGRTLVAGVARPR